MKKIILSITVIASFVLYSVVARKTGFGQTQLVLSKPQVTTSQVVTNTPSPTPSPSASPTPTTTDTPTNSPTQTAIPTPTPTSTPAPTPKGMYKDGTYTGSATDAYYGNIQVDAVISKGKIVKVDFLQAPSDNPNSTYINSQADPQLAKEAISAQNANVDIVSGATDSSSAFIQSLQSALDQAKN